MKRLVLSVLLSFAASAQAGSLSCLLGSRCLSSQGTTIPIKQVMKTLDDCNIVTNQDIGLTAIQMSFEQIYRRNPSGVSPLMLAWQTLGDLDGSPLQFERKQALVPKYWAIKRACIELNADFYTDSKWSK